MSLEDARFRQILADARDRTANRGTDTLVVAAHLAQMRLFMLRQGVEWFAKQDTYGVRRDFLRRVVDFNELLGRMEAIIDAFLCGGRGLLMMRPVKDLYRIHYFTEEQSRCYYDENDEVEEAQIIYPFQVKNTPGVGLDLGMSALSGNAMGSISGGNPSTRWVKLVITASKISQTITVQQPSFDNDIAAPYAATTKHFPNPLGFIPVVEVFNNRGLTAGIGRGEFDGVAGHILEHDRMVRTIRKNLQFFGSPTLVSSRPRSDLIEPDGEGGKPQRKSLASNSGFMNPTNQSTRTSDPAYLSVDGSLRVPRIISNVEAADRVNYISPDPVPGDLTGYTQQYQEMIRAALGGVDDLSISSGATAFEVRTLYGRVAATAKRKAKALYEYGFARLFSMMLMNEERIFRDSFAGAIGLKKPAPVLPEFLPPKYRNDPKVIGALEEEYRQNMIVYGQKIEKGLEEAKQKQELPPNVVGLIPDGDTRVEWRWTGEVFELSTQELLQNSIVVRNLQELGLTSVEALQYLFPDRTPEERAAMLQGFPFRMIEATQRSLGIFVDLQRALFQVPNPQAPDMPLAADPTLDLVPYLARCLSFLQRELSHSGSYQHADPASLPPNLSDADRIRAERGEPTDLERQRAQQRADAFRAAFGAFGRSAGALGSGVPATDGPGGQPLLPSGAGPLGFDPAGAQPPASPQLGPGGPAPGAWDSPDAPGAGGASWRVGPADLLSPTMGGANIAWVDGLPGPAAAGPDGPAADGSGGSGPARRTRKRRSSR